MKKIVVPGEIVTDDRKKLGSHVFIRDGKIHSDVLGIANAEGDYANVVPLVGSYAPEYNDLIVGIVVEEKMYGYMVDIGGFYPAFVSKREIREQLRVGFIISAKVMEVDEMQEAKLGFVRIFYGGNLFSIDAVKVPRVIGKNSSMLEVLKNGTGCSVLVGRNGKIWAKGGDLDLLLEALEMINEESHSENLTNRVEEFLKSKNKGAGKVSKKKENYTDENEKMSEDDINDKE